MKQTERVRFRLIVTPCCKHQLCWVNPRLPNFCPECGNAILSRLRTNPAFPVVDDSATLTYQP